MKNKIIGLIKKALQTCVQKELLPAVNLSYIEVEIPGTPSHGDYATNVALILASPSKQNPRKIAEIN